MPIPAIARCAAFFWARISIRTPATLRPSICTSFGSLIVGLRENSFRIAPEIASAAHAVSRGEFARSILGRKRIENQSPFPAADSFATKDRSGKFTTTHCVGRSEEHTSELQSLRHLV